MCKDLKPPWERERPVPENQALTPPVLGLLTWMHEGALVLPWDLLGQASDSWRSCSDPGFPAVLLLFFQLPQRESGAKQLTSLGASPRSPTPDS